MASLTVFTPAYNRAHTLTRTYKSLLSQSCKDFIWMIIDDGSKDNTAELVKKWQTEDNGFEIIYIYKENGGMHTAHNVAYDNINTELNMCIDSDDAVAKEAIFKILKKWENIKHLGYAGIVGLDVSMDTNEVIGKGFPECVNETTISDYYNNGGKGDKKLVYRTDIIKKYTPYPVFEGEKFFPLGYIYLLIDESYKLAVLNEPLCEVEYQVDGSSKNIVKQYFGSPKGYAMARLYSIKHCKSIKRRFVLCVHYVSSSFLSHNRLFLKQSPKKLETIIAIPFGLILTIYICLKVRK